MKVDYGAVALIPKGEFNATEQYAVNDLVSYNGSSFIVKAVPPIGTLPTNTAYFTTNASGTAPATPSTVGTVKPDNSTIDVDNNGVISVKSTVLDRVSSSEQALTVNLLNPTLASQTKNGITVTKNADNTYTLNGTATEDAYLVIGSLSENDIDQKMQYKLCGTPPTHVGTSEPYLFLDKQNPPVRDSGNGIIANRPIVFTNGTCSIYIRVQNGFTCDNLVFKPMITTNLSTTYDDYVPYSGSSGKLGTDFKTLSEKIGNVGNTDLQSQLNAATQSIAQNTTDIAANAAGISALNTGLANNGNGVAITDYAINNALFVADNIAIKQYGKRVTINAMLHTVAEVPALTQCIVMNVGRTYVPSSESGFVFTTDKLAATYNYLVVDEQGYVALKIRSAVAIPANSYCAIMAEYQLV